MAQSFDHLGLSSRANGSNIEKNPAYQEFPQSNIDNVGHIAGSSKNTYHSRNLSLDHMKNIFEVNYSSGLRNDDPILTRTNDSLFGSKLSNRPEGLSYLGHHRHQSQQILRQPYQEESKAGAEIFNRFSKPFMGSTSFHMNEMNPAQKQPFSVSLNTRDTEQGMQNRTENSESLHSQHTDDFRNNHVSQLPNIPRPGPIGHRRGQSLNYMPLSSDSAIYPNASEKSSGVPDLVVGAQTSSHRRAMSFINPFKPIPPNPCRTAKELVFTPLNGGESKTMTESFSSLSLMNSLQWENEIKSAPQSQHHFPQNDLANGYTKSPIRSVSSRYANNIPYMETEQKKDAFDRAYLAWNDHIIQANEHLRVPTNSSHHEENVRYSEHNSFVSPRDATFYPQNDNVECDERASDYSRNNTSTNARPSHLTLGKVSTQVGGQKNNLSGQYLNYSLQYHENNDSRTKNRKNLFSAYIPQNLIRHFLAEQRIVIGTLRVNKKNRSDAYVFSEALDHDVYICGSKDRNRALEGDKVAVNLLDPVEVWNNKLGKEEYKKRKMSNEHPTTFENLSNDSTGITIRAEAKIRDDFQVEGQSLHLEIDEEFADDNLPYYAGHVVAILDRSSNQNFTGTLTVLRPSSMATKNRNALERNKINSTKYNAPQQLTGKPKIIWFKPSDKRVPLIAIPTEQAPKDFLDNPENFSKQLYVVYMKRWPITSLHPFGAIITSLGDIGMPHVEVQAILRETSFNYEKIPDIPRNTSSELTEESILARKEEMVDFTSDDVFILENPDGDIATVAYSKLPSQPGLLKFAIHVVNCARIIPSGSVIDREARRRLTALDIKQVSVHLFASKFIKENLSLKVGQLSPVITVTATIDLQSEQLIETQVVEGFVRPNRKFNCGNLEEILSGKNSSVHENFLSELLFLCKSFRKRRLETSSNYYEFDQNYLDDPTMQGSTKSLASVLIGEATLLANSAVATLMMTADPSRAILFKQEAPSKSRMESLKKRLQQYGLSINTDSIDTIRHSISLITNQTIRRAVMFAFRKIFSESEYFIPSTTTPSSLFHHFTLNCFIYTDFSEPHKNYISVIIQRYLSNLIQESSRPCRVTSYSSENETNSADLDIKNILKLLTSYNTKKHYAKIAIERSLQLYVCEKVTKVLENNDYYLQIATVIDLKPSYFDIYFPDLALERRIHLDLLPLEKVEFDPLTSGLRLFWNSESDALPFTGLGKDRPTFELSPESANYYELYTAKSQYNTEKLREIYQKINESHPFNPDSLLITDSNSVQVIKPLTEIPVLLFTNVGIYSPPLVFAKVLNPFLFSTQQRSLTH